jgi:hypothetical protein
MVASYSDIEHHCGVTFTNLPLQVRPPGAKQIYRYIYISLISNGGDDEPVAHHSPKKSLPLLAFDEADNDARAVRILFVTSSLASKNQPVRIRSLDRKSWCPGFKQLYLTFSICFKTLKSQMVLFEQPRTKQESLSQRAKTFLS